MKRKIANAFFIAIIVYCSFIVLRLFFAGRTLWLDEGMLAWSFTQRSLSELISAPLEWMQSAPVLYLYIVKIITLIFGNNEYTLRIFSVICYGLTILLSYKLGKKFKYPLALCAFVAASHTCLRYANEFKPYISDCAAVLLVLYLYGLYREGKFKLSYLTIIFCILIWFSNPSCFFIAGILIFEFFRTPKRIFFAGLACLISFAAYFIVWLYPVIIDGGMTDWWVNQYFPLIPTSKEDLRKAYDMFHELASGLGTPYLGIAGFAILAFIKNIIKDRDPVIFASFIGCFIALIASFIECYPIQDRLWLFIYPLGAYLAFYFIDFNNDTVTLILSISMLFCTTGIQTYSPPNSAYFPGEEINEIIEYVNDKDDFIYVYNNAVPTFCYKNNYKVPDNVMLGDGYFLEYNDDLDEIKKKDSGYILISHPYGGKADGLFADLENNGYEISVVMESHGTPLYYFSK